MKRLVVQTGGTRTRFVGLKRTPCVLAIEWVDRRVARSWNRHEDDFQRALHHLGCLECRPAFPETLQLHVLTEWVEGRGPHRPRRRDHLLPRSALDTSALTSPFRKQYRTATKKPCSNTKTTRDHNRFRFGRCAKDESLGAGDYAAARATSLTRENGPNVSYRPSRRCTTRVTHFWKSHGLTNLCAAHPSSRHRSTRRNLRELTRDRRFLL